jgi:hypothetical protein
MVWWKFGEQRFPLLFDGAVAGPSRSFPCWVLSATTIWEWHSFAQCLPLQHHGQIPEGQTPQRGKDDNIPVLRRGVFFSCSILWQNAQLTTDKQAPLLPFLEGWIISFRAEQILIISWMESLLLWEHSASLQYLLTFSKANVEQARPLLHDLPVFSAKPSWGSQQNLRMAHQPLVGF